ncbi:hypothetical protein CORMATOL_02168 [Corynebacterium matruchotii ATCC 33806]|uniref:Uncharacterized protein n=1 Tax=Corynebacterium matruchotii ATCC 33806 TaxID=566549 RepID=C0E592_9CORY|nr:hypothetical protein CORMATOL_02168 [Corynebacterium matruchotii ATCC 33806]
MNRARFFGHGLTLDHAADIRFHPRFMPALRRSKVGMGLSYACSRYVIDGDYIAQ